MICCWHKITPASHFKDELWLVLNLYSWAGVVKLMMRALGNQRLWWREKIQIHPRPIEINRNSNTFSSENTSINEKTWTNEGKEINHNENFPQSPWQQFKRKINLHFKFRLKCLNYRNVTHIRNKLNHITAGSISWFSPYLWLKENTLKCAYAWDILYENSLLCG